MIVGTFPPKRERLESISVLSKGKLECKEKKCKVFIKQGGEYVEIAEVIGVDIIYGMEIGADPIVVNLEPGTKCIVKDIGRNRDELACSVHPRSRTR